MIIDFESYRICGIIAYVEYDYEVVIARQDVKYNTIADARLINNNIKYLDMAI